ncbi:hypothetical protein ACFQRC_07275 [Enterovirga sp. GCM10030262]|uniref:hypothetical protein n=1 Tax=Enterovirga sp. GCM10030262 TaxID=3273391 RepID=UPI00361F6E01
MSDRFVVEADRRVVGVAVRSAGGFRFFSSDAAYAGLEGRTFARAKALATSVAKVTRAQRRRAGAEPRLAPTLQ